MIDDLMRQAPRFFGYYNLLYILHAAFDTFVVSLLGCVLGYIFGFILGTLRLREVMPFAPVRWLSFVYTEAIRRIPFLVLILFTMYSYQLSLAEVSLFVVAITAVLLRMSALAAENIRAGYQSIQRTQWDAAAVMNMRPLQTLRTVILPQAWTVILPPMTVQTLGLIKDTALLSQIGFLELTFAGKMENLRGYSAVISYGTILVAYFVLSWCTAQVGHYAERKLTRRPRPSLSAATAVSM